VSDWQIPATPAAPSWPNVPDQPKRPRRWGLIVAAVCALLVLGAGAVVFALGTAEKDEAEDERAAAREQAEDARVVLRRTEADLAAARAAVATFAASAQRATAAGARVVELERMLVDRLTRLRAAGNAADAATHNRIVDELDASSDDLIDAFTDMDPPLADFSQALEGLPTARCTGRAGRRLQWTAYGSSGLECARLRVPLDYSAPNGEQIDITVVRRPADDAAASLGPLVLNPGGPGASGVAFIREASLLMPPELLRRFDLVTFDPRGVGHSTPVDCSDDLDPVFAGDLTAPSPADRDTDLDAAARVIRGCTRRSGSLLRHVDTTSAARDMDRIRAALGVEQLSYLGFSYGTYLGAIYADLFPTRVRAAVLDGAVHPDRASRGTATGDPAGFNAALDAALDDCAADPACAFYSLGMPQENYDSLMEHLSAVPLDVAGRKLGRTEAELAVVSGLYRGADGWPELMNALARAAEGNGAPLAALSDRYTGRRPDGSYNNEMEAHYAINCVDLGRRFTPRRARAAVRDLPNDPDRFEAVSVMLAIPCAFWPAPHVDPTSRPITADGAPPILVIGGEGDPATPIESAEALAKALVSGVLLRFEGTGHTAFGRGVSCVDDAVVAYLIELRAPADGTTCRDE
jgi:pimeloyl-ACP methyl ester carboxylesterase